MKIICHCCLVTLTCYKDKNYTLIWLRKKTNGFKIN